jgi:hypothetical protein
MNKDLSMVLVTMCIFIISVGVLLFQLAHNEAQMEMQAEIQLLQGKVERLERILDK